MARTYDLVVETSFMFQTRFHFIQGNGKSWIIIPKKGIMSCKIIGLDNQPIKINDQSKSNKISLNKFKGHKILYVNNFINDHYNKSDVKKTWKVKHVYGRLETINNEITDDFYKNDVVISTLDGYRKGPLTNKMKLAKLKKAVYTRIH